MRLTDSEQSLIRLVVAEIDSSAQVYLFGSRVDDNKKGGDIDLLIFSDVIHRQEKRSIKFKLYDTLGEQKIDILVAQNGSDDPFIQLAKKGGVLL